MTPYEFPEKAVYGKVIPKTKIHAYASVGTRVKEFLTRQVERITWAYKLSPKTINLPAGGHVQEVQVMVIDLKGGELSRDVLAAIDKAIPSPIIFVLRYKNKIRYAASYKRPSEADKRKRVISVYFESEWIKENAEKQSGQPTKKDKKSPDSREGRSQAGPKRQPLPVALDLKGLYHNLLKALIPLTAGNDESIDGLIARAEQVQVMQREAQKLEGRMNKEKQYNRKVELHGRLLELQKEMTRLIIEC